MANSTSSFNQVSEGQHKFFMVFLLGVCFDLKTTKIFEKVSSQHIDSRKMRVSHTIIVLWVRRISRCISISTSDLAR